MLLVMGVCILTLFVQGLAMASPPIVNSIRIKKVLPHYLDKQGKHTLSASLLERDAYQAQLRASPAKRGGLQFDILVSALPAETIYTLRIEARGSQNANPTQITLDRPLTGKDRLHRWITLTLSEADFTKLGNLIAWRAPIWQGENLSAEQKSFLW